MTEPEPSRLDRVKTMPRSVSQLTEYAECPYRYYLARVERVWSEPAAWFAQGTAVHRAAELWELTGREMTLPEAQAVYSTAYAADINDAAAETPRWDYWAASGPYACPEDVERRYSIGLEQVERYIGYYTEGPGAEEHPITVVADEKTRLAVEIPFEVGTGGVHVRGVIDAVMDSPKRGTVVRDNKTGNQPGKPLQLRVYGLALRRQYAVEPAYGDFWMGKTGKPTRSPVSLSEADDAEIVDAFGEMDSAVKAERFDPNPGEQCGRCPVRFSCPYRDA